MAITGMNHFTDPHRRRARGPWTSIAISSAWPMATGPTWAFPGAWLYVGAHAVLHIVGGRSRDALKPGVIDHIAFSATGLRATLDTLAARGIDPVVRQQQGTGFWQVFFHDPNGARVELDFAANDGHEHPQTSPLRGGADHERARAGVESATYSAAGPSQGARLRAASGVGVVISASPATLDHLVLAATTLADGIDYVASLTGVAPQPGGKHVAMGTHNALLRLGERVFLEIIAIDPDAVKPPHARWFELDRIALQSELTERPRLIHWVARTADIEHACAQCPVPLGEAQPMARGDYRWRITIPADGALPAQGPGADVDPVGRADASRRQAAGVECRPAQPRRDAPGTRDHTRGIGDIGPWRRPGGDLRPRNPARGDAAHAARNGDAILMMEP